MEEYDVVIIGSGMGGLACGNILAKHGYKVIILEKNNQIGGNLQVFSRDKALFDTGVHYLGGLDKGQNLYKLFKYFGIIDDLKLLRMDEDGFDHMYVGDEEHPYKMGMGYERFIEELAKRFPDEKKVIEKFCDLVKDFCSRFPLYSLKPESPDYTWDGTLSTNAKELLDELTDNQTLRAVLSGNNALFAGSLESPFYVWALVLNSYIESSWKCVNGGSQIAIQMQKQIRKEGGEILRRAEVVSVEMHETSKNIKEVILADGRRFKGKHFISNLHPKLTIDVVGKEHFRKAYTSRVNGLKNTLSSFTLHVTFKPNSFPYLNHNIYQTNLDDCWVCHGKVDDKWPDKFMLSTPASSMDQEFADAASVLCYMDYSEVEKWADTFNTVVNKSDRSTDYQEFKEYCCQKIIAKVSKRFPNFEDSILNYYSSSPLSFKDYIGTDDGSLYGIMKNSEDGIKTYINPKTRIPNLYLTGANLNLHGVLGVSISALVTCFEFIDRDKLIAAIETAND